MNNPQGQQLSIFDAPSMDSESSSVLYMIRCRRGRKNAVSVEAISTATGIPGRMVRTIVKGLIERHHIRIGSSLGNPAGYYMIETDEEAEQNERTLRTLGLSILTRASVLKGIGVREYIQSIQMELEL